MSDVVKTKRPRAPNFSPDEKMKLLTIIKKYKHIVENKKTDAVTWQDKSNAWAKIAAEFNATSTVRRSAESLKGLFENEKRKTHKKAAVDKKEVTATGGGKYTQYDDPLLNLTLDIVNKKTVYGLHNNFDGDCDVSTHENDSEAMDLEQEVAAAQLALGIENEQEDIETDPEIGCSPIPSVQKASTNQAFPAAVSKNDVEIHPEINWGDPSPSLLKTPLNKKLAAAVLNIETHSKTEGDPNPILLKTPLSKRVQARVLKKNTQPENIEWSSRRRPALCATTSLARQYEDLANSKREIAQIQLVILKRAEEFQKKMLAENEQKMEVEKARESELHYYKIKKEQLDVEIKEAQLKLLLAKK